MTSNQETTMSEQPWQPGPWTIGNQRVIDAEGKPLHRDPCGPNVKLEVLAPTMASAILAWDDDQNMPGHKPRVRACRELSDLADKLRGIGGKA
jgi:hypothetical protein